MAVHPIAIWEAFKGLAGLFGGETATEKPLHQQMTDVMPSLKDEAIQIALDNCLTQEQFRNIVKVRSLLEPHQRARWRETIGTLQLTEKFQKFLASEKITDYRDDQQQQQGAQPKGKGKNNILKEVVRTFSRHSHDYEFTLKDPRVKHLILIADLVDDAEIGNDEEKRLAWIKDHLLTAGLIREKSVAQEIKEETAQTLGAIRDKTSSTLHNAAAQMVLGKDLYETIDATADKDERDKSLAKAIAEAHTDEAKKLRHLRAQRYAQRQVIIRGFPIGWASIGGIAAILLLIATLI